MVSALAADSVTSTSRACTDRVDARTELEVVGCTAPHVGLHGVPAADADLEARRRAEEALVR